MKKLGWLVLCSAMCAAQGSAGVAGREAVRIGERCWADVRVLSGDAMEGRRAGTPGHRRAAELVASEFARAGLSPGGEAGFFQPVRLESRLLNERGSSLELVGEGTRTPLVAGDDAIISLRGNFAHQVEAPMVFVGDGLRLPQYGVDDLAGLDLTGKVVVTFITAPPGIPGAAAAHFGSSAERWKVYRAAGAIGVVFVPNPANMDLSWERLAHSRLDPYMALVDGEDPYLGQQLVLQWNPASFGKLLAGTSHEAREIFTALDAGAPLPHFDLGVRIVANIDARIETVVSENVIGVLPGSDPVLRDERVVLSAHLDHLGTAAEGEADRIFNGAMDNASGV